jgi:hypothetical protein
MLYKLNNQSKNNITPVQNTDFDQIGWTEKDLEGLISSNIKTILPDNQLMVIFQERQYQEEADIIAIDKNGILYIFELKRWESHRENILQVLRYGQKFGRYNYYDLEEMYRTYSGDNAANLVEKHFEHFKSRIENKLDMSNFNQRQYFIVITNGVDKDTIEAIQYWKKQGIQIDYLPYKLYTIDKDTYFEFRTFNPENDILYEGKRSIYFLNTNISWSETAYKEMLSENKAAAYGDRRYSIERIKSGDIILLYHTGCGIVAIGKAKGNIIKNEACEEYYIKVDYDWKIDPDNEKEKAIHAWEINQKLGSSYSFRGTLTSCEEETYDTILEIKKNKNVK